MSDNMLRLEDFEFLAGPVEKRMTPLPGISQEPAFALSRNRFIGSGTFCRVYELSETKVVKFSWDVETLLLLKRLGEKSPFFPKIYDVYVDAQAEDERGERYCAAVVERLRLDRSKWACDLVSCYRQPWPAISSHQSAIRLLGLRHRVLTGEFVAEQAVAAGLADALGFLANECMTNEFVADLRTDTNIMSRGNGHIVISDPAHPQKYMSDDY